MSLVKNPFSYSKIEKEDPEEMSHRRAQFLIYRVLEQAESRSQQRQSFLRIRLFRLKVKIGKRLKKLRKSAMVNVRTARDGVYKNLMGHLKSWRRIFLSNSRNGSGLPAPPLFTFEV